jgi:Ger(x)C family germination protein
MAPALARRVRRWARGLLALALAPWLAGCWDVQSPEHLLIPTLMAVDRASGRYTVTIQSVVPALLSVSPGSSGGSSGGTPPVWVVQGEGATVLSALQAATLDFPAPISLSHLEVLVLGPGVFSPRAMADVVDALLRSPYLTRSFWVYASPQPAAGVARAANALGLYPAQVLIRVAERETRTGRLAPIRFIRWLTDSRTVPETTTLLPWVTVRPASPPGSGDDFRFPGMALIRGGRVVGTLAPAQTADWSLVAPFPAGEHALRPLVTVTRGATRWVYQVARHRTQWTFSPTQVQVRLTLAATLVEADGTDPAAGDQSRLQEALARQVARDVDALVRWSQARHADIFDLGRLAAATDPTWWAAHAGRWAVLYSRLPVRVTVQARLEDVGNRLLP